MKHFCVISHTHWDREWYQTQEEFRMRLIDLFDHLLEILDANPDYVFHMDAQTIVFEDYWEVRPNMKEKCCKYVAEGRILAGPWYVQNDFYLTSGEATVRNLLIGIKQAEDMGRCAMTGYTPDQFGLISQLPQIFNGFGIDHCVFGRGYAHIEKQEDHTVQVLPKASEFLWKSPDGSNVLGIHMSRWYNNAQRFSADIERACKLVENTRNTLSDTATTPYLLLMNGVDHLEPQGDLLTILSEVQKRLPDDEKIYQTTLENFAACIRNVHSIDELEVEIGELNQGNDNSLLKDTASSRPYLKIENSHLQNMLENQLEPLYTFLELSGMKGVYPSDHLDYLWKMLIRNHAHDSICGCSKDAVHSHMEDRFKAIREMGEELLRRGMKQLAVHVKDNIDENNYQIVVFNGLECERSEIIDVTVDIVASDAPKGLRIFSCDGREIPFVLKNQYALGKSVFSAINLPGTVETIRYEIRMPAEHIPAFGYAVYRVETGENMIRNENVQTLLERKDSTYCMENDNIKITVYDNGQIDLYHKDSERCYENILTVTDIADIGNTYIFTPLQCDIPIDLAAFVPEVSVEESDMYVGRIKLHYELELPAFYDSQKQRRSNDIVRMPLDIFLELRNESRALDVRFEVENFAKDHRLDVRIKTGLKSDVVYASSPYDVIARNRWDIDTLVCNETEHTSGMVAIYENECGIAVLNRGVYAYEHLQSEQGTLTFPIVRATGVISAGVDSDDDVWKVPENQCLRKLSCEIAIMPQGQNETFCEALFEAKAYQNPLIVQCEPADARKFMGGRPAVQDTEIAEVFYQDIPYADVDLEKCGVGVAIKGEGLQITAFKKSFDRTGYILRFYNAKQEKVHAKIDFGRLLVQEVWKTDLQEKARHKVDLHNKEVQLSVREKEIVTLYIR